MKLVFHNAINFGDALNPVLFDHLLPGAFDQDRSEIFLGIGTIIGVIRLRRETKKAYIFSSGYGYSKVKKLDPRYEVLCVRGPLTAKALGLDRSLAISDGGIMAGTLLPEPIEKAYPVSFMPHHYSETKFDQWASLCKQAGIHFISPLITPENSVRHILTEIARTGRLISEALHGAIIADALRVPWTPVRFYRHINSFKWEDFSSSMELDVNLQKMPSIYTTEFLEEKFRSKIPASVPAALKQPIVSSGMLVFNRRTESVIRKFEHIKADDSAYLSHDEVLDRRLTQLYEKLEPFKK